MLSNADRDLRAKQRDDVSKETEEKEDMLQLRDSVID